MALFVLCLVLSSFLEHVTSLEHNVFIYKLLPGQGQSGQLIISGTLVWDSYTGKPEQLDLAIQGGKMITKEGLHPIYVCRLFIDGIYVSGHTRKFGQKQICTATIYSEVKSYDSFDLLINKGHSGQVNWKLWNRKTRNSILPGCVTTNSLVNEPYFFVARRKVEHQQHQNKGKELIGADYVLGRMEPYAGFGTLIVSEGDQERHYDDGELLNYDEVMEAQTTTTTTITTTSTTSTTTESTTINETKSTSNKVDKQPIVLTNYNQEDEEFQALVIVTLFSIFVIIGIFLTISTIYLIYKLLRSDESVVNVVAT